MVSLVFEEIKYFIFNRTKVAVLLIVAFSFSFIAINITFTNFIYAYNEQNAAEESYGDKVFYKITFIGEDEVINRLSSDEYKENIKELYDSLKQCSLFEYSCTLADSMLFYNEDDADYSSDDFPLYKKECLLGYEDGEADFYESENVLTLKAIYASPDFENEKHVTLSTGSWFATEDFTVSSPNDIVLPVLLGSAYKDLYQIGDKIENAHPATSKSVTLSVIGFLDEDSYFYDNNNEKVILNRYMIIPNYDIDYNYVLSDGNYESFFSDTYNIFNKLINARIICNDENADAASEMFYKMLNENKLYEFSLIDETSGMQQYLSSLKDQTVSCSIIAIFMILLSVVMFCFQVYYNIKKNRKKYGIYMINGITLKQLFALMIANALTIFILSDIVLFILNCFLNNGMLLDFGANDYTIAVLLAIETVLTVFMAFFGIHKIKKMNLCTLLRENE
jgi:hypothetical protein